VEVILLRHADARAARADEPDWQRPLSSKGEEQARGLAGALGSYAVAEIWSSPATRCRATVAELALRRGLEASLEPLLGEGTPDLFDVARFADRLEASLGGVLVCGHAPSLGRLLELLAARHGLSIARREMALAPATAMVLGYGDTAPRRLERLVRLDPPRWVPRRLVG